MRGKALSAILGSLIPLAVGACFLSFGFRSAYEEAVSGRSIGGASVTLLLAGSFAVIIFLCAVMYGRDVLLSDDLASSTCNIFARMFGIFTDVAVVMGVFSGVMLISVPEHLRFPWSCAVVVACIQGAAARHLSASFRSAPHATSRGTP